eukprot:gene6125-10134_t
MESKTETPPHGILKHDKKTDGKEKQFHWNEDNLEENEKIKKELNPQKIIEPKTPYSYHKEGDDENDTIVIETQEEEKEEIKTKGEKPKVVEERVQKQTENKAEEKSEWDEESEEEGEVIHDPNFEKKRKAHYNEFEMIKKMKEEGKLDDEVDEEEEEDDDDVVIVVT